MLFLWETSHNVQELKSSIVFLPSFLEIMYWEFQEINYDLRNSKKKKREKNEKLLCFTVTGIKL